MDEDIINKWEPLSQTEMVKVMTGYTSHWWLAGGYAIDHFLRKATRTHDDIDIVIPRNDQLEIQKFLKGWGLYIAAGDLTEWKEGIFLEHPIFDIWVMKNEWFRFQIMFLDTTADQWIFKRDANIGGPLSSFGSLIDGILTIKPEIQLLYKFHKTNPRQKDYQDWKNIYPKLDDQAKEWLGQYLTY